MSEAVAETKENEAPDCLMKVIDQYERNDCIPLKIRMEDYPYEEVVYLPARIVRSLLLKHRAHPSSQYIVSKKIADSSRKIGYREELILYTKEQLKDDKINIDKLINNNKVYINQQMIWIKNFSRFGDKVAEICELQEFDRKLSIVV